LFLDPQTFEPEGFGSWNESPEITRSARKIIESLRYSDPEGDSAWFQNDFLLVTRGELHCTASSIFADATIIFAGALTQDFCYRVAGSCLT
jgi:hypothetical protein